MICPNCKQEVTGKFCSYCGTILEEESVSLSDTPNDAAGQQSVSRGNTKNKKTQSDNTRTTVQTAQQTTKVKKKKKTKGSIPGKITSGISSGVSAAGSVTKGTVKTSWKLFLSVLQWLCGGLMLLITWKLFQGCWARRTALGSIMGVVEERNVNQAAYLILSLCLIGFGILQTLWIISRKKMADQGKVKRIDMGRGLFGFAIMLLLAAAAHYLYPLIPEHPYPLPGLRLLLGVVVGLGKEFWMLNLVGIVLCAARKVGTR